MIVREAWPFIIIGLILTAAFAVGAARWSNILLFVLSLITAFLTIFVFYFFRDPDRICPAETNVLVAPADGKIVAIDSLPDHEFIGSAAVRVSIFLSVFDVHVNRTPADGVIEYVEYNPGKFLAAYDDKASEVNEQTEIGMTSANGRRVVFKQIAGIIARRIVCELQAGDTVSAGDRFGMIRFGSRTDLIVPADSRITVNMGDHVAGGETVMGYLTDGNQSADTSRTGEDTDAEL